MSAPAPQATLPPMPKKRGADEDEASAAGPEMVQGFWHVTDKWSHGVQYVRRERGTGKRQLMAVSSGGLARALPRRRLRQQSACAVMHTCFNTSPPLPLSLPACADSTLITWVLPRPSTAVSASSSAGSAISALLAGSKAIRTCMCLLAVCAMSYMPSRSDSEQVVRVLPLYNSGVLRGTLLVKAYMIGCRFLGS